MAYDGFYSGLSTRATVNEILNLAIQTKDEIVAQVEAFADLVSDANAAAALASDSATAANTSALAAQQSAADAQAALNAMLQDAPSDGDLYGRQDGLWVAFSGAAGIPDAPVDGLTYGRQEVGWVTVVEEAPSDGNAYVRQDKSWVISSGGGSNPLLAVSDPTKDTDMNTYQPGAYLFTHPDPSMNWNTGAINPGMYIMYYKAGFVTFNYSWSQVFINDCLVNSGNDFIFCQQCPVIVHVQYNGTVPTIRAYCSNPSAFQVGGTSGADAGWSGGGLPLMTARDGRIVFGANSLDSFTGASLTVGATVNLGTMDGVVLTTTQLLNGILSTSDMSQSWPIVIRFQRLTSAGNPTSINFVVPTGASAAKRLSVIGTLVPDHLSSQFFN